MKILTPFVLFSAAATFAAQPLTVAVSVPPQKYVVEQIAGTNVNVLVVIDKGQDAHVFEPTPRKLEALRTAQVYLRIGLPFEKVIVERLAKTNPALRVVNMFHDEDDAHHTHDHAHGGLCHDAGMDPHSWMSPDELAEQAEIVAACLAELQPENNALYEQNRAAFAANMATLKADISTSLNASGTSVIAVHHPAWGHFAACFGLRQIAVEFNGATPSAKHLARVSKELKAANVNVMLVQNEAEAKCVKSFADKLGITVKTVNPLAENVVDTIRQSAAAISTNRTDK